MSRRVALVAAGMTAFGVRSASYRDLIVEAGAACLAGRPKLKSAIDGLVVGTVMPERTATQSHISSMAAELLGIKPRKLSARTEHMCASGTVGIRYAMAFIALGLADAILVLGVEKLNVPAKAEIALNMSCGVDHEWEASFGLAAPPAFALAAQAHQRKYGTTEDDLTSISLKNRAHAANNPYAHFRQVPTRDEVACSRLVATPLRLYHCSPVSDGAAAVVLAAEDVARDFTDRPVWILGSGQCLDGFTLSSLDADLSRWPAMERAAAEAYAAAGIRPDQVQFAEVHDCFAIAELIAYGGLGFCKVGEELDFLRAGENDYGGQVVVNPRGGLIGCGHPLGATGVAQACEAFWQLRGEAGPRQIEGARVGLTHNNSGMGEHVVMLYGRD